MVDMRVMCLPDEYATRVEMKIEYTKKYILTNMLFYIRTYI